MTLLLHKLHIKQLRELVDCLSGAAYFQFVVEVTKVERTKRGTMPKRIEISESLPPVKLDLTAAALNRKPVKQRKVW